MGRWEYFQHLGIELGGLLFGLHFFCAMPWPVVLGDKESGLLV